MEATAHIVTFSGRTVNPLDMKPGDIDIHDMAHALGNSCRFSGHVRKFYSVAEHSVRVTRWVKQSGGDVIDQRWALVHDGTEAYLIDLPKPLKADPKFGRPFRAAESKLEDVIAARFGLPGKMPQIVHDGDKALFGAESRDLMPSARQWEAWPVPDHIRVPVHEIKPWGPEKATRKFLDEFEILSAAGDKFWK